MLTAAGVAGVAITVQTTTTLTSRIAFDGRFDRVDATLEGNVWTWAASGAALCVAVAATACAMTEGRARLRLGALAATLAYFSLDDWFQIHEGVGTRIVDALGLPDYVGGLWVLVYFPLLLLVLWVLVATAQESLFPARSGLLVATALLVAAVAIELAGIPTKALARSGVEWPHDVRSALEEGLELGAWIIATGALLASFAERTATVVQGDRT